MLKDGRYAVYNLKPSKEGMEKHLSAVFAFKDGNFHLLEDHGNVFAQVHGEDGKKPSELLKHKLHSLMTNSSYVKVVPTKEDNIHSQEKRHVAEVELPDPHTGRQIFSYKHASHSGASPLVFEKGSFHLNGYPLSMDELHHLRKEVESGNAAVTYPDDMFKAEGDGSAQPPSNVSSLLRNKIKFSVDKSDMYGSGGLPSATVQLEFETPEHAKTVFNAIQNNKELRRSGHWAIDNYNGGTTIYAPISFKDHLPVHRHPLLEHQVKTIKSKFRNAGIDFMEEGDIPAVDYSQDGGEEPRLRAVSPTEETVPFGQLRHGRDPSTFFIKAEQDLAKATLYHGTIVDHEPSIRQIGVIPSTGDFIQDAYGDELEAPAEQDEMSFWADKHTFDRATTAMISHVARKLGKGFHDVNKDDIRNHGLLVISKGHEPQSHKRYSGWGMGRAPAKGNDYYNWEKPNPYIEPDDIFTTDPVGADITLKGSKLVSFLERMHGQKKGTQHPSKLGKAEEPVSEPDEPIVSIWLDFFNKDYLNPEISNLYSYRQFVANDPQGYHIYLASDSIKETLENEGVKPHNDILIAIAKMINQSASTTEEQGKTFRIGHDAYYVYFPSKTGALKFLYNLNAIVNEIPTLYSVHPYFDVGVGDSMENAYHALSQVQHMKVPNKDKGNHVVLHTEEGTRYLSPEDNDTAATIA